MLDWEGCHLNRDFELIHECNQATLPTLSSTRQLKLQKFVWHTHITCNGYSHAHCTGPRGTTAGATPPSKGTYERTRSYLPGFSAARETLLSS